MSEVIILKGYIQIPKGEREHAVAALEEHIALTRAEEGCLIFNITPDESSPYIFHVYEEFVDAAAFEYHQVRTRQSAWWQASKNVQRHFTQRHATASRV